MTLDIPTMYFISVVTNVAMTVAVMFVALRQSIPGLKLLAWALFSNTGYYLVLGARGMIPDIFAIGGGNALGSLTLTLVLLAVLRSRKSRLHCAFYWTPVLLVFLVSLIFLHDRVGRLTFASVILSYQIGLIFWSLWHRGIPLVGRGHKIMMATLVVGMSSMLYRAAALGLGWHETAPFQSRDGLNTIFYLINYLGMFFLAFGFVLSTIEQSAEQNRRYAYEDPLTGLANRRAAFEYMNDVFDEAFARKKPLALMVIDVDLFKSVNDRYGHQAGDEVLRLVAKTLRETARGGDVVGRFGGEEFLVVLPNTGPSCALKMADAMRVSVAQRRVSVGGNEIAVTISIGLFCDDHMSVETTPDVAIGYADKALYQAKASGRNRVETWA